MADYLYIGHGVYSVAEAAWLTGVPASTIRRWTRGYSYTRNGFRYELPPVFASTEAEDGPILRFVDLIEVRALRGFREKGVPWSILRIASHKSSSDHGPFASIFAAQLSHRWPPHPPASGRGGHCTISSPTSSILRTLSGLFCPTTS